MAKIYQWMGIAIFFVEVIQSKLPRMTVIGQSNLRLQLYSRIIIPLVQEGKSKKAKVKRKNAYFVSFLAILNGWFIYAVLY